jgi:hypothetical protein
MYQHMWIYVIAMAFGSFAANGLDLAVRLVFAY